MKSIKITKLLEIDFRMPRVNGEQCFTININPQLISVVSVYFYVANINELNFGEKSFS